MKWLLWAVIVGLCLLWITRGLRSKSAHSRPPAAPMPLPASAPPVAMLACSHCGVHLAAHDALRDRRERPYCSAAHRQAGPRATMASD